MSNVRVEALVMATLMAGEVTEPILKEARAIQAQLDTRSVLTVNAEILCPECAWTSADYERDEDYCNRAHVAWIVHYMDSHAPEPIRLEVST